MGPNPKDTVIPLGALDDALQLRSTICYSMLVFDHALDAEKLRTSLETLIERDGWRKLGARLRRKGLRRLEYHIPAEFTRSRPALSYSHVHHGMYKEEHAIASHLPSSSTEADTTADPGMYKTLLGCPEKPDSLDYYLNADVPQLGLHIVSFKDATLLTLVWPHTLFDIMGLKDLLTSWTLMLQGRADEILPPFDAGESDPFADLGQHPTEAHHLAPHRMSMFSAFRFVLNNLYGFLFPRYCRRIICVPGYLLDNLRESALRELHTEREEPFLSEGDILCALWTHLVAPKWEDKPERLVAVANVHSLRSLLSTELQASKVYLSNALVKITTLMSVKTILRKPLSHAALRVRESIEKSRRRQQIDAFVAMWKQSWHRQPPIFGTHNMYVVICSNWSKAKLFEVDFSSAAVDKESSAGGYPITPSFIQPHIVGVEGVDKMVVIGKDLEGNYWLDCCAARDEWERIERDIAYLRKLN